MTVLNINHYSKVLKMNHKANIIIPDTIKDLNKTPVIWLLHGYGGDESSWMRNTSIEALATEYSYIIIMPEGLHSFYVDSPNFNYFSFFINEFMPYIQSLFKLSKNQQHNFLCGASMGGFGALNFYLQNENHFGAVAALSPVMNLVDFIHNEQAPMTENEFFSIFNNLEYAEQKSININSIDPNIKIIVGKNDFLYKSISHSAIDFKTTEGNHTWLSWSKDIPEILKWFNDFR